MQIVARPARAEHRHREQSTWVSDQELTRDRAAHRVADDVRAVDFQVIEQTNDVSDHLRIPVLIDIVRLAALAVSAAVHRNRTIPG